MWIILLYLYWKNDKKIKWKYIGEWREKYLKGVSERIANYEYSNNKNIFFIIMFLIIKNIIDNIKNYILKKIIKK